MEGFQRGENAASDEFNVLSRQFCSARSFQRVKLEVLQREKGRWFFAMVDEASETRMALELLQDFFFTLYAHLRRAFEHDLVPRRGTGCLCLP